jgi:hypothetical protein
MRDWVVKRRERTRQLIELGGLVVKAGLVDLTDDDRATLYGAFLTVSDKLRSDDRGHALALWKRKGSRAFDAEQTGDSTLMRIETTEQQGTENCPSARLLNENQDRA